MAPIKPYMAERQTRRHTPREPEVEKVYGPNATYFLDPNAEGEGDNHMTRLMNANALKSIDPHRSKGI